MPVTLEEVERVLVQLQEPDQALRRQLHDTLQAWEKEPLPSEVAHRLLRAAADDYPSVEGWPSVPNEQLVSMLTHGAAVDPAVALEVYPRLDNEGRAWVLRLLAELSSKEASAALSQLLTSAHQGADLPNVDWPVLLPLETSPRHPELLAEPLIHCLHSNLWPSVAGTLLGYAQAQLLDAGQRRASATVAALRLSRLLDNPSNQDQQTDDEEADDVVRWEAGLLLELVGALQVEEGRTVLTAAARHEDTWLSLWGALGLVKLGAAAPAGAFERAAADPQSRSVLFDQLEALGQLEVFPTRYRTQDALAESDMVCWLIYPTELSQAPDEIEQVVVRRLDTADGIADLYVYRFRTFEPHWAADKGWMVGVAGPFLRREQPTTRSLGATFSRFESFEDRTTDQHIDAILGTLGEFGKPAAE
jgi:hypothetical protein